MNELFRSRVSKEIWRKRERVNILLSTLCIQKRISFMVHFFDELILVKRETREEDERLKSEKRNGNWLHLPNRSPFSIAFSLRCSTFIPRYDACVFYSYSIVHYFCRLVGRTVGWSVGWSVRLSVITLLSLAFSSLL